MDKNMIYEMVFEEIKNSLEWESNYKDNGYSLWVEGIISLADRLLKEIDKTKNMC